jgi:hypothetical protein
VLQSGRLLVFLGMASSSVVAVASSGGVGAEAVDLPLPEPASHIVPTPPDLEGEPSGLRDVSDAEAMAPLTESEIDVRGAMGFEPRTHSELTQDVELARGSIAEAGIRMTVSELQEYRARLELANSAAMVMGRLRTRPDFAGFFFDPFSSQYVARTTGDLDTTRDIVGLSLTTDRFRVEKADFSIDMLESLAHSIIPAFDRSEKDELLASRSSDFIQFAHLISVTVRQTENRVLVFADATLPAEVVDNITLMLGDAGQVLQRGLSGDETCTRDRCRPAVRPGAHIHVGVAAPPESCSAGPPFQSGSTVYLSTSGHCGPNTGTPQRLTSHHRDALSSGYGTQYVYTGYTGSTIRQNDSTLDVQLFPIARDLADTTPWGESTALDLSYSMNGAPEGTTMEVSRGQSDSVTSAVFYAYITSGSRLVGVMQSHVTAGGDSGSPWYVGRQLAGVHKGWIQLATPPDYQFITRSIFEQVQHIENELGVTHKTEAPRPERLTNETFASVSGGTPTSWGVLAATGGGMAHQRLLNSGHLAEHGWEFNCSGAVNCSVFQDVALTTGTANRISAGAWVFCNFTSPCPVTFVVWGHGGSAPASNLNRAETIPPLSTSYLWVEGTLSTGSHPLLRFQVYNGVVGGNIRVSSGQLHR